MEKDLLHVSSYTTNCGMLFQFEVDRYNIVYASSDINKIRNDLFYTKKDFDSELGLNKELLIGEDIYKIIDIKGYLNNSTKIDIPELLSGHQNKYSYVMVFTVEKVK